MLTSCFQVLSQLLRKAKQKNLVIPNVKQAGSEQGTYEGATVSKFYLHGHVYCFKNYNGFELIVPSTGLALFYVNISC